MATVSSWRNSETVPVCAKAKSIVENVTKDILSGKRTIPADLKGKVVPDELFFEPDSNASLVEMGDNKVLVMPEATLAKMQTWGERTKKNPITVSANNKRKSERLADGSMISSMSLLSQCITGLSRHRTRQVTVEEATMEAMVVEATETLAVGVWRRRGRRRRRRNLCESPTTFTGVKRQSSSRHRAHRRCCAPSR